MRRSLRLVGSLIADLAPATSSSCLRCAAVQGAVANSSVATPPAATPAAYRRAAFAHGSARAYSTTFTVGIEEEGYQSSSSSSSSDEDSFDGEGANSCEPDGAAYSLQASMVAIDAPAPNFSATAVIDDEIKWLKHEDYIGRWVLLFFYPKDFTFVCPTEIIAFSDAAPAFAEKNCTVIGASCDSAEVHMAWMRTPKRAGGLGQLAIPLLADVDRRVSKSYGVLNASNFPNRGIFLIAPDGMVKTISIVNNSVGRSVDEAMRLLDAFQFVEEHGQVCPANWKPGQRAMTAGVDESLEYFEASNDPAAGGADAGGAEGSEDADFGLTLHTVRSEQEFEELVQSGKPLVVDFMAGWCGKCRQIAPAVEALQREYSDVTFVKVDTSQDATAPLGERLGVSALPAFKFYKGGEEVLPEVVGYKKRPLENTVAKLQALE